MVDPLALCINETRLREDFDTLAEIGATLSGGVSRLALSNEDLEARAWFANRIEEAGMIVRDDEVGNLSAVLLSKNPQARTFLMGSHLDTVPNGGKYDGSIGVLAAFECLRVVKEAGLQLPVHLEAIDFTDEEGAWQSFFGSMGLAGTLEEAHINDAEQDNGAFRVALFRAGIRPSEVRLARRNPRTLAGFLELHIEQGEQLEKARRQIGIVTGIVGRVTYNYHFYGEALHAATTVPEKRRDALQSAAIFITEMHRLIRDQYPDGVVNCGNVQVIPGTFNVIPAKVTLRVECRHPDAEILAEMEKQLIELAKDCAQQHRLTVDARPVLRRPVARMSSQMIEAIRESCDAQGRTSMPLISYAGHDAQILNGITPTAMIFVPSRDGISHNPREYTDWNCVVAGTNIMLQTLLRLILIRTDEENGK